MKKSILIILLILCSAGAWAQTSALRTGYFLDRMYTNNQINPALMNDYGYFTIPMLGNINFGLNSNVGLNTFLYLSDDEILTYLHPDVAAEDFNSSINDENIISQTFSMDILSAGFYKWGGFNTFNVSLKQSSNISLPGELFKMFKGGSDLYNISGLSVDVQSYAEIALGHAREINEKLTVGAKVKILAGLADANLTIDELNLSMTDELWQLQTKANGSIAALGTTVVYTDSEGEIVTNDEMTPGIAGMGFGLDLGATYKVIKNLTVSAAITDIGFISWKNSSNIIVKDTEITLISASQEIDPEKFEDELNDKIDNITEELEGMYSIEESGESYSKSLSTTINIGAEYSILDNLVSFGALYTTRIGGAIKLNEIMGVINYRPFDNLNFAVSGSVSNYGTSWGWVLDYCPSKFINLFVGTDCMISKVSPQYIPVNNAKVNASFGLSVPLGAKPTK